MTVDDLDPFLKQTISDLQERMDKVGFFHKAAVVGVTARKLDEDGAPEPEVIIIERTRPRGRRLRQAFMRAGTWIIQKVVFRLFPSAWLTHKAERARRFDSRASGPLTIIDQEAAPAGGGQNQQGGAQSYISAGTDEEGD